MTLQSALQRKLVRPLLVFMLFHATSLVCQETCVKADRPTLAGIAVCLDKLSIEVDTIESHLPLSGGQSPLKVRGGSAEINSDRSEGGGVWIKTANWYQTQPGKLVNTIRLNNVALTKHGSDLSDLNLPVDENWIVTIKFKSPDGQADPSKTLQFCTFLDSQGKCATSGGAIGASIYIKGDGNGAFTDPGAEELLVYNITTACLVSGSANHICNEISKIKVTTDADTTQEFYCKDFKKCTIIFKSGS